MARQERSAGFVIYRTRSNRSQAGGNEAPTEGIEYLLLDYGRHWDFPKGHVEKGEDDLEAAIRELREETGITDAQAVPGFQHEITYYFRDRRRGLVRKTVVFFLGLTTTDAAVLSEEHVGYDFLPYAEALNRVTYPSARQILRAANQHLSQPPASATPDKLS